MSRRMAIGAWVVLPLIAVAGCGTQQPGRSGSAGSGSSPSLPQSAVFAAGCKIDVTEGEARAYADKLMSALRRRRVEELRSLIDYELTAKIASRGLTNPAAIG